MTKYTYLDREYTCKSNPNDFIKYFKNLQEFEEWCCISNLKDLKVALISFKEHELYEYCKIIQESIDSLTKAFYAFKKDVFID